ncbi:MAG: Nif11 family protein [Spirochaetales bacterium]|nr:Nif11 family protein [Spirochaetales bacterium]
MSVYAAKKFYLDSRTNGELRKLIYKADNLEHCLELIEEQGYAFNNEELHHAINIIRANAQARTIDLEAQEFIQMWNIALDLVPRK